jgi:hypothetical protein
MTGSRQPRVRLIALMRSARASEVIGACSPGWCDLVVTMGAIDDPFGRAYSARTPRVAMSVRAATPRPFAYTFEGHAISIDDDGGHPT